jgi:protein-S-isoprenylcysteine O-methyltransferase Ste14
VGKRNTTILQRIRVPLGFVFGALFLYFSSPTPLLLAVGVSIALVGLLIRAWSSGHIRKNKELATSGPYARTRNPLYLGSFIMGAGFMVASGVWWLVVIFVILFLGIYLPVMRIEARELTQIFAKEYEEYADSVPLFFPGLRRLAGSDRKFDSKLYLRYREYQAAIGFAAIVATLVFKAYLLK